MFLKTKTQVILNSFAILLACTLLFSLIFGTLYYFAKISTSTFHILNWIGGIIAFMAGGCMLGFKVNKKALLHAFLIVLVLSVLMFLLSGFDFMTSIEIISKCFAYILACMLTFNLTNHSNS